MIESELKIPVANLAPVRRRLSDLAARRITEAELEINILFDRADDQLRSSHQVLRLRRIGAHVVLTHKGPASWRGAVKQRRETEVEVSSGSRTEEILKALGYARWLRYDKIRESWSLASVRVDLDRTPMGTFVEIEGPVKELEVTAMKLGIDPAAAVPGSYVSLWQHYRRQHPELGQDMVFDP